MMKIIQNIFITIASFFVTFLIINLLVSIFTLNFFNQNFLPRHWSLNSDRYFSTFYPNTHDKTLKNYNAILGDSNSFGEGDGWVNKEINYSISHYLHKIDYQNYLNFSKPGANSITAVKEFVFTLNNMKDSIFLPETDNPNEIIIFFDEGDILANYQSYNNQNDINDINKFVKNEINNLSDYNHRIINLYLPLLKSSYIVFKEKLIHYIYLGVVRKILVKFDLKESRSAIKKQKIEKSDEFILNSNNIIYPGKIRGSYILLSEKEKEIGLKIFYQSVIYLKENYPDASLKIVMIPPALNVYNWIYPITVEEQSLNKKVKVENSNILKKYISISNKIELFSKNEMIAFVDCLNDLSKIAKNEYIHGTRDSKHYNPKGYEYIAKVVNSY